MNSADNPRASLLLCIATFVLALLAGFLLLAGGGPTVGGFGLGTLLGSLAILVLFFPLIAILTGATLAFFAPGLVLWMRPALQPAFALTMLAVGTLVRPEQVRVFARAARSDGG